MSVAVAAITIGALPVFLVASMGYQIREDLSLEIPHLGMGVATFFLFSACTSLVAGPFLDRREASTLAQVSASLTAVALLGLASTTRGRVGLVSWLALSGISLAIATAGATLIIARHVDVGRLGLAFGVKQASGPMATLLAGASLPIVGVAFGWRWTMVIGAGLCAGFASMAALWKMPHGSGREFQPPARQNTQHSRLSLAALVTIGAGFGLGNLASVTLGAFVVTFAIDQGVAPSTAGLWLVSGSSVAICSRIVLGIQADRSSRRHLRTIALMLMMGSCGLLLMAIGPTRVLLPAIILAFSAGWGWSGLLSMAVVLENMSVPAFATAVTHAGGFLGSAIGPVVFGYLAGRAGYEVAWLSAAFAACLGGAVMLVLDLLVRRRAS